MPPKFSCNSCCKRLRRDGSCPSEGCSKFRPSQRAHSKHSKDTCSGCCHRLRLDGTCDNEQCDKFQPSLRGYRKWRKETVTRWKSMTPKRASTSSQLVLRRMRTKTCIVSPIPSSSAMPAQEAIHHGTSGTITSEARTTKSDPQPCDPPSLSHANRTATGLPIGPTARASHIKPMASSSMHRSVAAYLSRPSFMESCAQEMGAAVSHGVMATAHSILERCIDIPAGPPDQVAAALLGIAAALTCPTFSIARNHDVDIESSLVWRAWLEQTAGIEHIQNVLKLQPQWLMLMPFAYETKGLDKSA